MFKRLFFMYLTSSVQLISSADLVFQITKPSKQQSGHILTIALSLSVSLGTQRGWGYFAVQGDNVPHCPGFAAGRQRATLCTCNFARRTTVVKNQFQLASFLLLGTSCPGNWCNYGCTARNCLRQPAAELSLLFFLFFFNPSPPPHTHTHAHVRSRVSVHSPHPPSLSNRLLLFLLLLTSAAEVCKLAV